MTRKRPNFLIFITDQQRADHLSCVGNTVLRTPHIDALAERGRRFDRFYASSPICMPNRATLFTGRLPSAHGAHCNGAPLNLRANTVTEMLRQTGYRTRLVGKSHVQNMTGRPAAMKRNDRDDRLTVTQAYRDALIDPMRDGRYDQEDSKKWETDADHGLDLPYYGFEKVDLCTMHGDVVGGDWRRWARGKEPRIDHMAGPENARPDPRYTTPQAYRTQVPEELYPTNYVVEQTVAELQDLKKGTDEPFFLVSSFPDPHHPFTPPGRYWDMYDPADIDVPTTLAGREEPLSPVLEHMRRERAEGRQNAGGTLPYLVTEKEAREAIALTYGMISMIDDGVGRVMDELGALGLEEDTIVVFMSDHGDFMGDHGLMLKSTLHYQGLIRIPFIWSEPGMPQAGRATDALHSTLDFARTVLGKAGVNPYWGIQGNDMAACLVDPDDTGPAAVLVEEDGHETSMGFSEPARVRTVITKTHRMSIYDGCDWGEIYDLQADPDEMTNLFEDPKQSGVRQQLFEQLTRLMVLNADASPFPTGRA